MGLVIPSVTPEAFQAGESMKMGLALLYIISKGLFLLPALIVCRLKSHLCGAHIQWNPRIINAVWQGLPVTGIRFLRYSIYDPHEGTQSFILLPKLLLACFLYGKSNERLA